MRSSKNALFKGPPTRPLARVMNLHLAKAPAADTAPISCYAPRRRMSRGPYLVPAAPCERGRGRRGRCRRSWWCTRATTGPSCPSSSCSRPRIKRWCPPPESRTRGVRVEPFGDVSPWNVRVEPRANGTSAVRVAAPSAPPPYRRPPRLLASRCTGEMCSPVAPARGRREAGVSAASVCSAPPRALPWRAAVRGTAHIHSARTCTRRGPVFQGRAAADSNGRVVGYVASRG